MEIQQQFVSANQALGKVIAQITDQWDDPVPEHMSWQPNQTVYSIVNYHAYDDACVPDVLAGDAKEQWESKHQMGADLLGDDRLANYAKYNRVACDAVRGFTELDRPTHLSYGDYPAGEYLEHISLFRGLRVLDFAQILGVPHNLPDAVAQALLDYVKHKEKLLREMHIIGDALPIANDAPVADRLAAFTGRSTTP
jgi:hypothetical protein